MREEVVSDHRKGTTPNGTQEENVGQCSTLISPIDAPNKGNVLLNVIDSPTIDLIKPGSISGPTSYAKLVTSESNRKSVNIRTLTTTVGNEADVTIPLESIRAISERSEDGLNAILENEDVGSVLVWVKFYGVPMTAFSKDGLSFVATKLVDEELKDFIMIAMLKIIGEGFNMYTVCVNYEWKPPRCSSCKVFGHVLNECPKKIVLDVVKNLNNPRQATRGVLVVPKVSFKSTKQIYKPISNKNGASTSGRKKQAKMSRQENPPVPTVNVHSESEVEVVTDETTNLIASMSFKDGNDTSHGTNSLLEQLRETK
ncbi:hypothetical protein Tco_1123432 [Tanacetum coccineum]|uniref:Zinc knuckle CX2CX4HX4C n=1 Tax=Tanacetum coccineum TaxID=301880 RepID=A0ABQ5J3B2_9ASTR